MSTTLFIKAITYCLFMISGFLECSMNIGTMFHCLKNFSSFLVLMSLALVITRSFVSEVDGIYCFMYVSIINAVQSFFLEQTLFCCCLFYFNDSLSLSLSLSLS